jgi:hypothetical protein
MHDCDEGAGRKVGDLEWNPAESRAQSRLRLRHVSQRHRISDRLTRSDGFTLAVRCARDEKTRAHDERNGS